MRLATDQLASAARVRLRELAPQVGEELVDALLDAEQGSEAGIHEQRQRVAELKARLAALATPAAEALATLADHLVRRSVWIIGGDGWAYDIGFGGLDHVLASGEDVNILVLDTEVYSNTGGQNSKGHAARGSGQFAAGGKPNHKKDLARIAMDYENVHVAQVAYGARMYTLKAFLEAESYPGVSIIIAYSPCIAHGVDMQHNHRQQDLAVKSGHWPLLRYDPRQREGQNPLSVDSAAPSIPFGDFARHEARFTVLERLNPRPRPASSPRPARTPACATRNTWNSRRWCRPKWPSKKPQETQPKARRRPMPDLSTTYLGLALKNPLVPSSTPLSHELDAILHLEDAGAAAVVMHSLFEEDVKRDEQMMDRFLLNPDAFGESAGHLPAGHDYLSRLDTYLEQIQRLKSRLSIPVVASLNGSSPGGWVELGKEMQAAGADAIELNAWYMPSDAGLAASAIEARYLSLLQELKAVVSVPISMKLSPFFSSLPHFVHSGRAGRRRRGLDVQPLLPAGHRPRHPHGGGPRSAFILGRRPARDALDCHPARQHPHLAGRDRRCPCR